MSEALRDTDLAPHRPNAGLLLLTHKIFARVTEDFVAEWLKDRDVQLTSLLALERARSEEMTLARTRKMARRLEVLQEMIEEKGGIWEATFSVGPVKWASEMHWWAVRGCGVLERGDWHVRSFSDPATYFTFISICADTSSIHITSSTAGSLSSPSLPVSRAMKCTRRPHQLIFM